MQNEGIYISELSTSKHVFNQYHFCRGNSNKRKTRLGIILEGSGAYIYLGKRLKVSKGDAVFIPENVFCYSEWRGSPDIAVVYLSCFMHYEGLKYEPQIIDIDDAAKSEIMQIHALLSGRSPLGQIDILEAYSRFYKLLQSVVIKLIPSDIGLDKTLMTAIEYVTDNWNCDFTVGDIARKCCVSESTLYHLFQKQLGQTPIKFLNSIKINIAIEYLENSNYSVATISEAVGFNSENHFRKTFRDLTGMTPLKYRSSVSSGIRQIETR